MFNRLNMTGLISKSFLDEERDMYIHGLYVYSDGEGGVKIVNRDTGKIVYDDKVSDSASLEKIINNIINTWGKL